MDHTAWVVDWNPDFEDDLPVKREVLQALKEPSVMRTITQLTDQAIQEAVDDGLETEHLVWLDTRGNYAFFVRIWFEASEEKAFVIIEENDLGDIGFLLLDDHDCATYGSTPDVLKVELRDPETLGVSR